MEIELLQFQNGKPLVLNAQHQHLTEKINQLKQAKKFGQILKIADGMRECSEKYLIATNALLHLRDWKKLWEYCHKGLTIAQQGQFYHLGGKAIGKLGDNVKKIEFIQKAIQYNADIPAYHRNLGAAFYSLHQYQNAAMSHYNAIKLEPNNSINYHNRGAAYFRLNQFDKAKQHFCKSIECDQKQALSHSWLGDCYKEEKQYQKACECYSIAYEISKNPIYMRELQKMQKLIKLKSEIPSFN